MLSKPIINIYINTIPDKEPSYPTLTKEEHEKKFNDYINMFFSYSDRRDKA